MPQKRFDADALGVVTVCLVALFVVFGLFCIVYSVYFRTRVRRQGFVRLRYFSGPWIIRIIFILLAIWWGVGEIIRLNLLRSEGRILNVNFEWQRIVCKGYIVSNLGFAEPCFLLTLVFLLRGSLQKTESGTLRHQWNCKTAGYIVLYCFPIFVLQLMVVIVGPKLNKRGSSLHQLPHYFTNTVAPSMRKNDTDVALCTYPLMSTIFLCIFDTVLTTYMFWLGRRILYLVINKGLHKRVYTLILSVSSFVSFRIILLGLSVLSKPENVWFELLSFLAFLSLFCCAGLGVCILVYLPIADSLALRNVQDMEARSGDDQHDTVSLITNQSSLEEISAGRNSGTSAKRGSISFRTMDKDQASGTFVELSLFSPSQHSSPPGSPQLMGWPMLPSAQLQEL
ncbi:Plant organelle RNA recognition domain-containing protein [Heracleum sosnowskyi]|uniref:Plant organelle RNA recognition domain-containing protein n=1 Tax=Heracleum sosnowskyi TaxID=360622 RepID=A0AAD8JE20_9APIA|nr:Plant organelle RNA recognition domain-containing protein [Heracleum sosnowskyi]